MDNDISQAKNMSERRFRTLLLLMRLAGVRFNTNISIVHAIYSGFTVMCHCVTCFSVIMDTIVSSQNFEETMNHVRAVYAFGLVTWMYFSVRYVSSQSIVMLTFLQYLFTNVITEPG
jgi:hypothetical protein